MGKFCKKCGDYVFDGKECSCKRFELEHDGETFWQYGKHLNDALERYAKFYSESYDNYLIGDEIEVYMDGQKYILTADFTINYWVKECDENA